MGRTHIFATECQAEKASQPPCEGRSSDTCYAWPHVSHPVPKSTQERKGCQLRMKLRQGFDWRESEPP